MEPPSRMKDRMSCACDGFFYDDFFGVRNIAYGGIQRSAAQGCETCGILIEACVEASGYDITPNDTLTRRGYKYLGDEDIVLTLSHLRESPKVRLLIHSVQGNESRVNSSITWLDQL